MLDPDSRPDLQRFARTLLEGERSMQQMATGPRSPTREASYDSTMGGRSDEDVSSRGTSPSSVTWAGDFGVPWWAPEAAAQHRAIPALLVKLSASYAPHQHDQLVDFKRSVLPALLLSRVSRPQAVALPHPSDASYA